jgi:CDP-4-dehydro-6-deoxyglucose reductase
MQRASQAVLLRIESWLNRIFGAEHNPFYQLGAIGYFLFWVVAASGFYIYAFYRTGVTEAYASVESITHGQWYLGGVMRSLHRYSSDGMVLIALVHMWRNFATNRLAGFRAFSWYTGMLLLLFVFVSGINGYFLVWDQLAQFIAVASTEWLDWIPFFSSPLVRNFLLESSVNDRFFSLLSFAHIGVPLVMLAFIMIHTQRVSGARTQPVRRLAAGILATLLVLSLVKPALSQAPANLSRVATQVQLDWFFLAPYPLVYRWSPGQLWAAVGGVMGLLLLLPLLARTRRTAPSFLITSSPSVHSFTARAGETILEAALRQHVRLPYLCRDGACGTCKGSVLRGSVDHGVHQADILTDREKRDGKTLYCCATPLSDLEIEFRENESLHSLPVRTLECRVESMHQVAPEVMILTLRPVAAAALAFLPGQYIDILLPDGARRSFSFANAPHAGDGIELHVRRIEGGRFTSHVFTRMKVGDSLNVEGPLGTPFVDEDPGQRPVIFVAGATGYAPVRSILEHAFHTGSRGRKLLYWGARTRADLYDLDRPERWQREHAEFTFVPVLSAPLSGDDWKGRVGLVHEAILQDFPDLQSFRVYACGSLQMVQASRPAFLAHGLPENACQSDAFLMSVRPAAQVAT